MAMDRSVWVCHASQICNAEQQILRLGALRVCVIASSNRIPPLPALRGIGDVFLELFRYVELRKADVETSNYNSIHCHCNF